MVPDRPSALRHRFPPLAALAAMVTAMACGGDSPTEPRPDPDPVATTLAIVAGDAQTGTVGEPLGTDPAVVVRDQFGDPMGGVTVTWAAGTGSVSAATSTTNAQGVAAIAWTLGTAAGAQTLTAQAAGLTAVTFDATADPGPASSLAVTPDTVRFAALAASDTVEATAEDAYGNPVTVTPTFTSRDPAVATVDGTGEVSAAGNGATWILVDAGSVQDSARVEVNQAAASIVVSPTADTINAIGYTVALSAEVLDAGGSPLASASVSFASLAPAVATVDGAGTVTSASTGTAPIVASFGGLADTATVVSRQVAASLAVTPSGDIALAYGDTLRILVSAQDSAGVDMPASAASITTGDAGVASVSGALLTAGTAEGTTVLTVAADGLQATSDVSVSSAGFDRSWQGGHTGAPTAWSSPYNWAPAGYPGAADTLQVGATANDPVLAAGDTAAALTVAGGAVVDLGGFTLRLTDDVDAPGAVANGTLEMVGTAATACGTVPTLLLAPADGSAPRPVVTLTCDLLVNGTVTSLGGLIANAGFTLTASP
jgi:hypothetical protein